LVEGKFSRASKGKGTTTTSSSKTKKDDDYDQNKTTKDDSRSKSSPSHRGGIDGRKGSWWKLEASDDDHCLSRKQQPNESNHSTVSCDSMEQHRQAQNLGQATRNLVKDTTTNTNTTTEPLTIPHDGNTQLTPGSHKSSTGTDSKKSMDRHNLRRTRSAAAGTPTTKTKSKSLPARSAPGRSKSATVSNRRRSPERSTRKKSSTESRDSILSSIDAAYGSKSPKSGIAKPPLVSPSPQRLHRTVCEASPSGTTSTTSSITATDFTSSTAYERLSELEKVRKFLTSNEYESKRKEILASI